METIMIFSERLKRVLREEVKLLNGVEDLIQTLHTQIELMSSFLNDANLSKEGEIGVIEEKILELARESEIAIDTFIVNMMQQQQQHKSEEEHRKQLCDALHGFENLIADIQRSMEEFYAKHSGRSIQSQAHASSSLASVSGRKWKRELIIKESRIVGREDDMEELLDLLIEGDSRLSVIEIVGEDGLGKTTLAAEAYNSVYVKNYFDCRAWVRLSKESFRRRSIFLRLRQPTMVIVEEILKSVMPLCDSKVRTEEDFEKKRITLCDYLRNKRYLIVLDDLWLSNLNFLQRLSLSDDNNGSRILLTTTKKRMDVAPFVGATSSTLKLNPLNRKASWELLTNRVYSKESFPLELEPVKNLMEDMCFGSPLNILLFAGLLLEKDKQEVLSKLKNYDNDVAHPISEFIAHSYFHLPQYLKPCFLYFAAFPGNSEISTRELYQLWIAEGFIHDNNETIAENHLKELIDRGFIQVLKRRSDGRIRTCCFHDLSRDFTHRESNKNKFLKVNNGVPLDLWQPLALNHQRLAIHGRSGMVILPKNSNPYLHSLLYFAIKCRLTVDKISEKFNFLRVLDLRPLVVNHFPFGIENLLLLRYLRLNAPSLTSIPSSICSLLYLYTLDLPFSHIEHTPNEIWKMKELRHLNFAFIILPGHPSKDCISLENLNFISTLCPSSCTQDVFSMLPDLRTLRIKGDLSSHQEALANHLSLLCCLESLKLIRDSNLSPSSLINLSEFRFPPSLTHLTLANTELRDDPMPTLEKLPNLQVLKLKQNSYRGRKLTCSSGGFPQLEVLDMKSMQWLEEWTMETGAMPILVSLVINPCAYLRRLPEELWRVKTFYKLELWWPRPELKPRLREVEDMDRYDIQIYPSGV